ncbi:MAG TPA: AmmeMemoRadiSam system protein B [Pyrinomonadaceae bacterium]|nr:AmmeMemoRadiSam system protein B [Pyrinomonadaceae bacterium]
MNSSPLVFVGIAPHPPVMVTEVGGAMADEVRASIDAMRDFTERIKECGAETVIIISPHAPLEARAFVAYEGSLLRGDFANFRAPQATVEVPLDHELLAAVKESAVEQHYSVVGLKDYALDHGTAVPLYFLLRNGWSGRVVALGYSFLSNEDHVSFGVCIRRAVERVGRPVAFVASGDLSHRLIPTAPAGFHTDAHLFDQEVIDAIRSGVPERVINIDQNLRRLAGECGYRSMLVAFGVSAESEPRYEVLNYEAPFGVGYLVAQLARSNPDEAIEAKKGANIG